MMNRHGWGLREMIIFSSIIVIALIFVSVLIRSLYHEFESNSNSSYITVENNLKKAARRYYTKNKSSVTGILLSEDLIDENYLTSTVMQVGKDICTGYVIPEEDFATYITCSNYETEGY